MLALMLALSLLADWNATCLLQVLAHIYVLLIQK